MILLLTVFTGMLFIIIKSLNMLLSHEVGIFKSNVTNHLTGLIGTLFLCFLFLRTSTFNPNQLLNIGIFPLIGGILGATFVTLSNYTFSKTKVLISTLLILVGQTVASVIMDYFMFDTKISLSAVIGILLIILAVYLYNKKDLKEIS